MRAMPVVAVPGANVADCTGCPAQLTNWYEKSGSSVYVAGAGGGGTSFTVTWNVTVRDCPPGIAPSGMPAAGSAPACGAPFTVTLPGTRAVPAGSAAVSTPFEASIVPELGSTIV